MLQNKILVATDVILRLSDDISEEIEAEIIAATHNHREGVRNHVVRHPTSDEALELFDVILKIINLFNDGSGHGLHTGEVIKPGPGGCEADPGEELVFRQSGVEKRGNGVFDPEVGSQEIGEDFAVGEAAVGEMGGERVAVRVVVGLNRRISEDENGWESWPGSGGGPAADGGERSEE
nr:hypothetical protein Iba_chr12aCG18600 [Ipomoea batatas]